MAVPYYGDIAEDATIELPFNTFSSDDPSASVTITNLVDADLKVHKGSGATAIVTDGATINIDFATVTGNHLAVIDTSVHADYAVSNNYHVRMEGTTVDGGTINAWIGSFSIENREGHTKGALILTDTESIITDSEAVLTDSEAILVDTEAATAVITDTEAILADSETINTATAATLVDTEAAVPVLTDTEALLVDTEAIVVDTEAILVDTEALGVGSGLTALGSGTAQSGTATTIVLAAVDAFADNVLNGNVIKIHTGTGAGQSRVILSNTLADDTCNITPNWTTNPDATSQYEIVEGSSNITAVSNVAEDVATETTAAAVLVDTEAAAAVITDTEAILADSEAVLVDTEAATAVLTDTEAIIADTEAAITARATLLTDTEAILVDTEAGSGAAILADTEAIIADTEAAAGVITDTEAILIDTEAAVGVITDTEAILVDSEAIKAKTDSLTFTVAGKADANITHVNEIEVTGDGETGTEWNPV